MQRGAVLVTNDGEDLELVLALDSSRRRNLLSLVRLFKIACILRVKNFPSNSDDRGSNDLSKRTRSEEISASTSEIILATMLMMAHRLEARARFSVDLRYNVNNTYYSPMTRPVRGAIDLVDFDSMPGRFPRYFRSFDHFAASETRATRCDFRDRDR